MSSKIFIRYENSLEWVIPSHEIDISYWTPRGKDMINRSLFPNNQWCLTCNKPESVLVNDTTYGHWNYCKCNRDKFSLGNLPPQPTAEFISKHRRTTMKWAVSAEITLQDGDDKTKVLPIVGYVTFEVEADDLDAAIVIARGMLEANTNEGIISSIAAVLEA